MAKKSIRKNKNKKEKKDDVDLSANTEENLDEDQVVDQSVNQDSVQESGQEHDPEIENEPENEPDSELNIEEAEGYAESRKRADDAINILDSARLELDQHMTSYHSAIQKVCWYIYPAKDFKESNHRSAPPIYQFRRKEDASRIFSEARLQEEGYSILQGVELNRLHSYSIMNIREHAKY